MVELRGYMFGYFNCLFFDDEVINGDGILVNKVGCRVVIIVFNFLVFVVYRCEGVGLIVFESIWMNLCW